MASPVMSSQYFVLYGRWIPGTVDRICLSKDDQLSLEISIHFLWQVFGQEAVDGLYLRGKAELECDTQLWALLIAGSVPVEPGTPNRTAIWGL